MVSPFEVNPTLSRGSETGFSRPQPVEDFLACNGPAIVGSLTSSVCSQSTVFPLLSLFTSSVHDKSLYPSCLQCLHLLSSTLPQHVTISYHNVERESLRLRVELSSVKRDGKPFQILQLQSFQQLPCPLVNVGNPAIMTRRHPRRTCPN